MNYSNLRYFVNGRTQHTVLFPLLLLLAAAGNIHAQSFGKRFFLSGETSLNTSKREGPAAISLAAEPKVWVSNHFYLGLKCDVAVGSLGDNEYHTEPPLGSLTSLFLHAYYEERFGYANCFVGFGLGHFSNNVFYEADQGVTFPGSVLPPHFFQHRVAPGWARSFSFGVKGDHGYMGMGFKKSFKNVGGRKAPPVMSATVGVEFGNGRHLTRPRWYNEGSLPPIMLEVGQQFAAPVGTGVAAISRATYAELKFGFKQKCSVGVRLVDFPREGYGTDRDGYALEYQQVASLPYVHFGRINTMQLVHSNTLFFDYYFPRKSGWIYVGAGGGWYRFEGLEDVAYQSGTNQPTLTVPGIPAANRAGAVLRIGHKVGFFRTGLDLNLTGAGVPDYLSFHLGLELGLYVSKE